MIGQFRKFFLVWESQKMINIGHLVFHQTIIEIHLKRSTGSCFVNNYNPVLLKAWKENLDIQPVHNHFKALTYMAAYFPKS